MSSRVAIETPEVADLAVYVRAQIGVEAVEGYWVPKAVDNRLAAYRSICN